jgi:hypothetical protein
VSEAQFQSTCPACEGSIVFGQPIAYGLDGWQHTVCPSDLETDVRAACTHCWQVITVTGACGCEEL